WNRRAISRSAAALEDLNDDHAATAARTRMRGCLRLTVVGPVGTTGVILRRRHVEQLPRSRNVLGAPAVGEQTVVTDAVETIGQDVDEEAADELVDGERHHLGSVMPVGAVVLPFEGYARIGDADQAAVGDRDAV